MRYNNKNPIRTTIFGLLTVIIIPVLWLLSPYLISITSPAYTPEPWPPINNEYFPDLDLIDQEGQPLKLSYLKGKVIILQPIHMGRGLCQALSGSNFYGPYDSIPLVRNISSLKSSIRKYTKYTKLPHPDIVFVQLLMFNLKAKHPSPEDAKNWARHFHMQKNKNEFVVVSSKSLVSFDSMKIPSGVFLIAKDFKLRADSTTNTPKHSLERQLIPLIPKLIR